MPAAKSQAQGKGAGPSGSSSSKSQRKANASAAITEGAEEDPLVAVILADSFDNRFSPLTVNKPRCLLPLCGVPLINFSLERLLQAGVSKVHVLANHHASLVRAHVDALRKTGALTGMDVIVYAIPDARSVGDAMRELDSKELIRGGDFILVQPDCIGNVDIKAQVRVHLERRKLDKDAIMTMGAVRTVKGARNCPPGSRPIAAIRPATSQLLHYDLPLAEPRSSRTSIPLDTDGDLFATSETGEADSGDVELRMDLRETGIDICSFDVPALFSENFDYQTFRRDFVVGILTSDLLESKIFVHVSEGAAAYGARADSTRVYDAIAVDILNKYTWPMVPGAPGWPGERLEARQGHRYVGSRGIDVHSTATVGHEVLLSSGSAVAASSNIHRSVLGDSTTIGEGSTVSGSHFFEHCSVGKGCHITSSILGANVRILDGVTLERGCLIGEGCIVGPNVVLAAGSRVCLRRKSQLSEDGDDVGRKGKDVNTRSARGQDRRLGAESAGHLWPRREQQEQSSKDESDDDSEDSDAEEIEESESPRNLRHLLIGFTEGAVPVTSAQRRGSDASQHSSTLSSIEGDSDFDGEGTESASDSDDESTSASMTPLDAATKALNISADGETAMEAQAASDRLSEFQDEALLSLHRAFDEGHTIENASIELKTLRMSTNVPLSEVRRIVTEALLERCDAGKPKEMVSWLDRWGPLLSAITTGTGNQTSGGPDIEGVEIIDSMQTYCARHSASHASLFVPLLKKFYNDDLLTDESLIDWWKSPTSRQADGLGEEDGARRLDLRQKAEAVVRWVAEQDESESESE